MISDVRRAVAGALVLVLAVAGCSGSTEPGVAVPLPSPVAVSSAVRTTVNVPTMTVPSAVAEPSTGPAIPTTPIARPTASAPPSRTGTGTSQISADPNVAGPEHGPPCAVAAQYSDEAPAGLRADVLAAWLPVRKLAAGKGVTLCLNDGKRSAAQQRALFALYVKEYGTLAAQEYVLPPGSSAHVKGYAVDVQPAAANQWLLASKGRFGWCRIYDNEPWHFEYSVTYRTSGCPARLPKPVP